MFSFPPKSICGGCFRGDEKFVPLPCGHLLCRKCWAWALHHKVLNLACSYDNRDVTKSWLERLTKEDFKQPKKQTSIWTPLESAGSSSGKVPRNSSNVTSTDRIQNVKSKLQEIECPKCRGSCYQSAEDAAATLGTCQPCALMFCSLCGNSYHGVLECPTNDAGPPENTKAATENNLQMETQASFAPPNMSSFCPMLPICTLPISTPVAKPYELEFYAAQDRQDSNFSPEDIAAAFLDEGSISGAGAFENWPWDELIPPEHVYGLDPTLYPSLRPGNWAEDELLENSIKIYLKNEKLETRIVLLESFVMNWSMRKGDNDIELLKLLHSKRILDKEIILTLINTEFGGIGGHWILGVVHVGSRRIFIQDSSLVLSPTFYQKYFFLQLRILYLAARLRFEKFNAHDWKLGVSLDSVQQRNSYDCGPIALCNAIGVTRNVQLDNLPNLDRVRMWLIHNLEKYGNVLKENDLGSIFELNVPYLSQLAEGFNPKGLHIIYSFFKGKLLF